jgi:putative addiction module CopG family antidote
MTDHVNGYRAAPFSIGAWARAAIRVPLNIVFMAAAVRTRPSFPKDRPATKLRCMATVTLTPDLERFAADAVANGRYRNVGEVVQAGVSLLRRAEAERVAFVASLEAAEAESERDGFLTADEVHREMRDLLEEMDRTRK